MLGRNAHTGVADGKVAAVVVHPPAHLERALGRGALRGVVDEVRECRVDLRLVADQLRVGLDLHPDIARVHRPGHGVLAQQREQSRHVDRLPAERLSGLLEPRELEEVPDDARHALGLAAHLRDRPLEIRVERGIVAESLEIARDHGERGAQLVRGVGDEVAPHRLEPHLARHVAYQQQQLPVSVRDHLQRQVRVRGGRLPDHHRVGEVLPRQVARELGLPQQVLDPHAEVAGAPQIQQPRRHAVEPYDLALRVEDDDAVRERRGRALQLAHELHETLLVEALAAMQPHDLGNDLAPHAAGVGRIGVAAVAQPPLESKKVHEHPHKMQRERPRQSDPGVAEEPPDAAADHHGAEQPHRREPPRLRRRLHGAYSVRAEKRYPEPRTVCTKRSYPKSSSALRRRRMCTSMVRSSTYTLPPQMRSSS